MALRRRFCSECGTPVAQATPSAEYKQVPILFADVVHSMDIAAALGAERLREIMGELVQLGWVCNVITAQSTPLATALQPGLGASLWKITIRAALRLWKSEGTRRLADGVERRDDAALQPRRPPFRSGGRRQIGCGGGCTIGDR